jgi:hypothetical protein
MRQSGFIQRGRKRKALLGERTLIKVETVLWEQIFVVDLNHY